MRARAGLLLPTAAVSVVFATAAAQTPSTYDPAQLPSVQGKVAAYSLSPRGDVDGLILEDDTEVHLPPHLGAQLVSAVKRGDAVTVHGLRARAVPMVQAMSVTNDATGRTVTDTGPGGSGSQDGPAGPGVPGRDQTAQGTVRTRLHGPRGELNGVLLEDGTIVRLPPPEARRLARELTPGAPLLVQGPGSSSLLGRVILADRIGPGSGRLVPVEESPPGREHRPGRPDAPAASTAAGSPPSSLR